MIDWETFKSQLQSDPGRMLKSVLLLAGCLFMIWLIVVMQSNPGMQNVQVESSGRLDSLGLAEMQSGSGDRSTGALKQSVPGDSTGAADMQSGSAESLGVAETKNGAEGERTPGMTETKTQTGSGGSLNDAKTQSANGLTIGNARPNDVNVPANTIRARDNGFSGVFPTVLIFLVLIGGAWYWLRTQKKSDTKQGAGPLFTTVASQHLPGGPKLTVVKLNEEYWVMASGGPQGTQLLHRYTPEEWQGIEKQEKKNWKNTFLKTLNSSASASTSSSQQKKTG
jgi:hypothetical protein